MFGLSSRMLSERSSYSAGDTGWASLNSALSNHMQKKKPQMTATVFFLCCRTLQRKAQRRGNHARTLLHVFHTLAPYKGAATVLMLMPCQPPLHAPCNRLQRESVYRKRRLRTEGQFELIGSENV